MNIQIFFLENTNLLFGEADESEPPALSGVPVLGDVDVPNLPVLLEEVLQVPVRRPVRQVVHLKGHHPDQRISLLFSYKLLY